MAALLVMMALMPGARASITYDVSIDTRQLPPGQYQALFVLTDPSSPDNFSRAALADSFSIDGDVIKDSSHYYADQPVIPIAPPVPLNFYLTLSGAAGDSDYFLMALRAPDGGIVPAVDGSQWLLSAPMDRNSPLLSFDPPRAVKMSIVTVPEPLPALIMLIALSWVLLKRRTCCR